MDVFIKYARLICFIFEIGAYAKMRQMGERPGCQALPAFLAGRSGLVTHFLVPRVVCPQ